MDSAYDVIIVGGGIHGAGVAQAAAAHGYSVLVAERAAIAVGTSGRSSKLIHGGLRYLESGQVRLVRECLRERAHLLRLAPELVRLRPFLLPVYETGRRRPWELRLGLTAYAVLGAFGRATRFGSVPAREWPDLDGLRTDGLRAVYRYQDAQTDDALLTRAVMQSARELGAELLVPARFTEARIETNGRDAPCQVHLLVDGQDRPYRARAIVNAAGPWAHQVLDAITPAPSKQPVELVQGAHLLVTGSIARGIYYVESPDDGRGVFVMPWRDETLVGTTETPYRGHPDDVRPLPEEQDYLLRALRHAFPASTGAVRSAFAGLRVLPTGAGRPFDRSRETVLDVDRRRRPRVVTIYGGKLTAYRVTAEHVIARLRASLPRRRRVADTRSLPLAPPGGAASGPSDTP